MPDTTPAAPPQTAAGLPPRYGAPISLADAKRVMEAAERETALNFGLRLLSMPTLVALEGGVPLIARGNT